MTRDRRWHVWHLAPNDEETRAGIRRFGLLPGRPTDQWGFGVERQPRGVYVAALRPPSPWLYDDVWDVYRVTLPLGLRTLRDPLSWDRAPWATGALLVIPCRVPPVWLAVIREAS